jgi:hypothetical protein
MKDLLGRSLPTPRLLVVGLLFFAACHRQTPESKPAPQPTRQRQTPAPGGITSATALLQAMHDRYPQWYHTLTFVQKTTLYRPNGGELVQTWYEAASLPGRLRIDTDLAAKSGTLFARDSVFSISSGRLVRADTGFNELLVLGFDVYTQAPSRTHAQLRRLGYDFSRMYDTTWQGRPVYVVGAVRGDTLTKQFWVDKANLLFVRLLERGPRGLVDLRFDRYQPLGKGWIAMEVLQLVDGKPSLREEYSNPRADVALPDGLFDPRQWSSVHWTKPSSPKR